MAAAPVRAAKSRRARGAPMRARALGLWQRRLDASALERRFAEIFEREVAVFLVPTGTAANALALAHLTPPWGAVLCHAEAHIATDECGAPEFFGGGIKLIGLPGEGGKIAPADARRRARARSMGRAASRQRRRSLSLYAGDRSRHDLSRRRDRGACRDRARARAGGAYGRRALRQCARAHERDARRMRPGRRASTCCRSAPPRAARSPPKRWCSSIRRAPPACRSAASAAAS